MGIGVHLSIGNRAICKPGLSGFYSEAELRRMPRKAMCIFVSGDVKEGCDGILYAYAIEEIENFYIAERRTDPRIPIKDRPTGVLIIQNYYLEDVERRLLTQAKREATMRARKHGGKVKIFDLVADKKKRCGKLEELAASEEAKGFENFRTKY